ncbi:hypothetical protein [Alteribacillus sp. HJP-4]|uniref:hypothetical protein n=1 Tax=Alteribacillus sp. HJP-4 TaxID=2775394 RepID=UPI0035CD0720
MKILTDSYKKRPIRCLEIWEYDKWKMKLYSISCNKEKISKIVVDTTKRITEQDILESKNNSYKLGFSIAHQAREAVFILVNWWIKDNMLRSHIYRSPLHSPEKIINVTSTGESMCIWEIYVLNFERNAWVKHVLQNQSKESISNYLHCQLNDEI